MQRLEQKVSHGTFTEAPEPEIDGEPARFSPVHDALREPAVFCRPCCAQSLEARLAAFKSFRALHAVHDALDRLCVRVGCFHQSVATRNA